jgi:hypothetical protein
MANEPTRSIPYNPVYSALSPFPVAVYADSAAVTLSSGIVQITKAGVAALTLAAPVEDGRALARVLMLAHSAARLAMALRSIPIMARGMFGLVHRSTLHGHNGRG